MGSYRSGHNGAVLKTVRVQAHAGSNPALPAKKQPTGCFFHGLPKCGVGLVQRRIDIRDKLCNIFHRLLRRILFVYPWIYKPHYREERMHLQESIFMLWGSYQGAFTANISEKEYMSTGIVENADGGVLCSILIPAGNKKELLNALHSCGVNEKFIYPGLDGIGKYILSVECTLEGCTEIVVIIKEFLTESSYL